MNEEGYEYDFNAALEEAELLEELWQDAIDVDNEIWGDWE